MRRRLPADNYFFAFQVLKADSMADCLSVCLQAKLTFDFDCQSLMYYPESRDCLLNVDKRGIGSQLVPEPDEVPVAYMEKVFKTGNAIRITRNALCEILYAFSL